MGKGNSDQAAKMSAEVGKEMIGLNRQLQTEAAPWRQAAGSAYMAQLNDPSKAVASATNSLARDAASAKSQISEMQPGGARDRAMRDLTMSQMTGRAQLLNSGHQAAAQALGNLGVGVSQAGIGAAGTGNQAAQNLGQIGAQQKAGLSSGAAGFGALLGGI